MSLLQHTSVGNVQSVDFFYSDCKMATSLPHMLKIKKYHKFFFLGNVQMQFTLDVFH